MATEDKRKAGGSDLLEQAMRSYEQAVKTGLRVQEEASRMWTGLASQAAGPEEWRKKANALAEEVVAQTQKNMEEYLKLIDRNSRVSLELLKQAVASAQVGSVEEAQTRLVNLWEASLNAVRDTAVSASQANARAVESWLSAVRRGWDTVAARG